MAIDSNLVSDFLDNSMVADVTLRRAAEKELEQFQEKDGYCQCLASLLNPDVSTVEIELAAAIALKNLVKKRYVPPDAGGFCDADRTYLKDNLVAVMLSSSSFVRRQLAETISIIGRLDFPDQWEQLIPSLVATFTTNDFNAIAAALSTAHSLFKRYRSEMKSVKLWQEILYVLRNLADPLTDLFQLVASFILGNNDPGALEPAYQLMALIVKTFYSLNAQDLPEFFEDNMPKWFPKMLELLKKNEAQPILKEHSAEVKSQICFVATMYAQKYEEEFKGYISGFVETIWMLLLTTGADAELDQLAYNGIEFLAVVAAKEQYKSLFEGPGVLEQIAEKVIIPNAALRESDLELFEDNPEDYIRRDIEGSDSYSRRKAADDFVRVLSLRFEERIIQILSSYIEKMLATGPTGDSKTQCFDRSTAIFLITALTTKGYTAKQGVTQVSPHINIPDFCRKQVCPYLDPSGPAILHADALKFVTCFRGILGRTVPLAPIVALLSSKSMVVHSYAGNAIEKMIVYKDANKQPILTPDDLRPLLPSFIQNAVATLELPGSSENEYIMKVVMRVFSVLQNDIAGSSEELLTLESQKLLQAAKNPSKPLFYHYLFETVCLTIRATLLADRANIAKVEAKLFAPFQELLQQDVAEFMPYVFQVLALMLSSYDKTIPPPYLDLFRFLLAPALWERQGNATALVKLITVYLQNGSKVLLEEHGHLNAILGTCQRLTASKAMDQDGFELLQALLLHAPTQIEPQLKAIFIMLFQRLQVTKTGKFVKGLMTFLAVFMIQYRPASLIAAIDGIQANMFGMVMEKVVLSDLKNITGHSEKKLCSVGYTMLLSEDTMLKGAYAQFWPPLLEALIGIHELPEDEERVDPDAVLEKAEYNTAFNQLQFAVLISARPDVTQVQDPRTYLAQSVDQLSKRNPGMLRPLIGSIAPNAQQFLKGYMDSAGVTIV